MPVRRRISIMLAVVAALTAMALLVAAEERPSGMPAAPAGAAVNKAGIASSLYLERDPAKLTALGASWAYDWTSKPLPAEAGLEWVPMVWGARSVTPAVLSALREDHRERRARYLLAFNEPDSASQSNMTPEQAAALWPRLESTGLLLGSPAPATPTDGWLAQFMRLARERHLRVNFIALHYYVDFTDPKAVAELRSQLLEMHSTYRLPIWITEIGAVDIRRWGQPMLHTPTAALATSYMRRVLPMLNRLPFVQRYAWFTDNCWNDNGCRYSSLFSGANVLTTAGRAFKRAA